MCVKVTEVYQGIWSAPACIQFTVSVTDILILYQEVQMVSVSSQFDKFRD